MLPEKISVVGTGKLGLCLAAALASKGFRVTGVDTDAAKVESINAGRAPLYEPGLRELIRASRKRLRATTKVEEAVLDTDATFVVVPTPSDETGEFSLCYVTAVMGEIAEALRLKRGYHLIVLTSTVMPGSLDDVVRPLLEGRSGRRVGRDFGLCYSPELIALGDVIKGLFEPDFLIIGESDRDAGAALSAIKRRLCDNLPPIAHMNFVNAELAKIALNSFVTMKMSFANTLAEICEKLPGANVDIVTGAIGQDKRIGQRNLKGALGYGGPCFPRDNVAFAHFAERIGAQSELALATHKVNLRQALRVVRLVESEFSQDSRIAVLGLSYKPNTNVVEGSQSVMIVTELCKRGYQVSVYDPAISQDGLLLDLGPKAHFERDIEACLANADVCIIATPWQAFSRLSAGLFSGKTVIDCWRVMPRETEMVARYIPLGVHRGQLRMIAKQLEGAFPATYRLRR